MPDYPQITTVNRQAIVFLLDQSGSMSEPIKWNNRHISKAIAVAEVINQTIYELLIRCKSLTEYKPYFDIALIGYSGSGVKSLINIDKSFVTPTELASTFIDEKKITNIRTRADGKKVTTTTIQKIWVKPLADGRTPMVGAFTKTYEILSNWMTHKQKTNCLAPIVINITDGEATDGDSDDLMKITDKLKNLKTILGETIIINIHISNHLQGSIIFPNSNNCPIIDNVKAAILFNISSIMPDFYNYEISQISNDVPPYKSFAFNASIIDLIRIINIGSSATMLT